MSEWITSILNWFNAGILQLLQWIIAFVAGFVDIILSLLLGLLTFLVGLLPAVPSAPAYVLNFGGFVNYLLPISEAFTMLTLAGTVYALLYGYKLVKLLRGGG
jgi:hypothetical protein